MLSFANINIFTIIILFISLLLIILLIGKSYHNKKQLLQELPGLQNRSIFLNILKLICLGISLICLEIIFLQPIGGKLMVNNSLLGIDISIVLDVSKSMQVSDINGISRLEVIKNQLNQFINEHPSDRFGLTIFAGEALSILPLTSEKNIFLDMLANVDENNLTKLGTNLESGIIRGVERLKSSQDRSKILLLITDGGDLDTTFAYNKVQPLFQTGNIHLIIMGIGTILGGYIPDTHNVWGETIYKKYQGKLVLSQLNNQLLTSIADKLGGEYFSHEDSRQNINNKLDQYIKKAYNQKIYQNNINLSREFAIVSLIFFVIFIILNIIELQFKKS